MIAVRTFGGFRLPKKKVQYAIVRIIGRMIAVNAQTTWERILVARLFNVADHSGGVYVRKGSDLSLPIYPLFANRPTQWCCIERVHPNTSEIAVEAPTLLKATTVDVT